MRSWFISRTRGRLLPQVKLQPAVVLFRTPTVYQQPLVFIITSRANANRTFGTSANSVRIGYYPAKSQAAANGKIGIPIRFRIRYGSRLFPIFLTKARSTQRTRSFIIFFSFLCVLCELCVFVRRIKKNILMLHHRGYLPHRRGF
jgi:hypothetical protein